MPADARDSKSPSNLRHKALDRLSKGSAPPMRGWGIGIEALTLLYTLASTPGSAVDAHKLLHELQVHQVELDLQHEEMELSRGELASNLQLHVELFDLAPVAYLGVDLDGIILRSYLAADRLFGSERSRMGGIRIASLLVPGDRTRFDAILQRMRAGESQVACEVRLARADGEPLAVNLIGNCAADGQSFLIVAIEMHQGEAPGKSA